MQQLLHEEIAAADGLLPFDRFMELALYAPGLGYYQNGLLKFGRDGDFVTAPELSPLFGRCLARQCAEVLGPMGDTILELGAGSGRLAADLLGELEHLERLPARYLILELSATLRERQRQLLQHERPHLLPRVTWLDRLPTTPLRGLILGNEVLDAMPVHLFRKASDGGVEEGFVSAAGGGLQLAWDAPRSPGLMPAIVRLEQRYGAFAPGYQSEINLRLAPWLAAIAEVLQQGMLVLVDYGYSGVEYYHPDRSMGTLVCHRRHRAGSDPLQTPGLQDITASVDFSAVAAAAEQAGLALLGYTSQAHLLINLGIDQLLAANGETPPDLDALQAAKQLLLPSAMGERFRAIALGRDAAYVPRGFRQGDWRGRLDGPVTR
jgi:SAM-dependent MidA family methyltransferase